MKRSNLGLSLLAFSLAGLIASCDKQPPAADSAPVASEAPAVEAPAQPAVAQAPDQVNPEDLQAGLAIMQPRASNAIDGFNKIEVLPSGRYFLHPSMEKDASIEFDTQGLASLRLAPYLGDLNANSDCLSSATAGIVKLTWALDDGAPVDLTVDRTYGGTVDINVGDAKKLKLVVNQGNGEIGCDWFSVGFTNVVQK